MASPDAPAVESIDELLTFRELGRRANAIADTLHEIGVAPGDRVAILAHRSPASIAAALATMALRASYVPIDPSYPRGRVDAIVGAAEPVTMLYDGARGAAPETGPAPIDLSSIGGRDGAFPGSPPVAGDVAYVIFTSGSTGAPKGVMVEHASLVNYIGWGAGVVGTEGIGAPLFASLAVDHAVTCLWLPLAMGRRVVLAGSLLEQDLLFGARPTPYTFIKTTPSHARFFERFGRPDYARVTRLLMFGGERLDLALLERLGERIHGIRLVNHYGPTEATVGCCWNEFDLDRVRGLPAVPIGRPISNCRAYVVDGDARPAAPGLRGELMIAGACVARGYLGDPEATAAKFLDESTVDERRGGRAYLTGDVVEVLDDGLLLYVGRVDDEVKVGGFRIEVGELRRHALGVDGVADAAVDVIRADVEAVEIFVVPNAGGDAPERIADAVRRKLADVLPPPLVPRRIHVVPRIEVSAAGKCDVPATRRLVR
ncbi:MAG: amino acid adenylation domain-containing protein [Actinomycetota bacterium]|nr:amino acid adenylation domain-containing protein [Actinomycetota bacterium]